jgi:hypothetical protein
MESLERVTERSVVIASRHGARTIMRTTLCACQWRTRQQHFSQQQAISSSAKTEGMQISTFRGNTEYRIGKEHPQWSWFIFRAAQYLGRR